MGAFDSTGKTRSNKNVGTPPSAYRTSRSKGKFWDNYDAEQAREREKKRQGLPYRLDNP
jgi:hypothetical protein